MKKIVKDKSKYIVDEVIEKVEIKYNVAIDATMGKGNDTIKLAKKLGSDGIVYSFDIQDIAICNTKNKLKELNINNVELIKDSHENLSEYIKEKADLIIFNLGYLPGFDKNIKTKASSTEIGIKKSLEILGLGGILIITLYTGHEGSLEEKFAIEKLFKNISQKEYAMQKIEFFNQINNPPIVYLIEKIGEEI